MTVEDLAKLSETSAKQVARFILILETHGYTFRKRMRSNGVLEYRLIVEPREHTPIQQLQS